MITDSNRKVEVIGELGMWWIKDNELVIRQGLIPKIVIEDKMPIRILERKESGEFNLPEDRNITKIRNCDCYKVSVEGKVPDEYFFAQRRLGGYYTIPSDPKGPRRRYALSRAFE